MGMSKELCNALRQVDPSPFALDAADKLAWAVFRLVEMGVIEARTAASDALESYLDQRFDVRDGSGFNRFRELFSEEELKSLEYFKNRKEKEK